MIRKIIITTLFLWSTLLFAQTGSIKGRVYDSLSGESLSFSNVQLEQRGVIITKMSADIDGEYIIKSLEPGKYDIKALFVGYRTVLVKNVEVYADKVIVQDLIMNASSVLQEYVIMDYIAPVIDPDTRSGGTVTREYYQAIPSKNINSVMSSQSGVISRSGVVNYRGGRSSGNSYYIDGIPVSGTNANYGAEEYKSLGENKFMKVKKDPLSTFSIDVDKASYSNVRRFINERAMPPKDAVRLEEMINYFSYNYPRPKEQEPFSITLEASDCPWNEKHKLIHVGLQGKKIETENLPPGNLVFLLDVSGSMDSPDKLPLLQSSLKMLVEQLREQDRVSIVVYAGNAGLVLDATRGDKKDKIYEAIDNLSAGGSTAGGAGIQLAYKIAKENFISKGNNRVILATDGDFNVGVSSDEELVKLIEEKRNDGIFLTVLGFGTGNYKDSKMEQLADKGNGNYAYVDNLLEAKKVLVKEMGATIYTIAKDVKIQVEFNPAHVKGYRLLGYEDRMLAAEDFNNDKKDAGEIGSGHTVTALYEIIPAGSDEEVDNIDSLKYQKINSAPELTHNGELLTIKFRYKDPDGNKSMLIQQTLPDSIARLHQTSDNFRFAAAVAELGLLLKDSEFKGTANYDDVIKMAKNAKGNDEEGYRAEFIRLAETAEILAKETAKITQR